MTELRLRRGPVCRLASSATQMGLSAICLIVLYAIGYSLVQGHSPFGGSVWAWIWTLLFFLPWLGGVTAWARADDQGLRWRYWLRQSFRWDQITRITLTRRDLLTARAGLNKTLTVVVHARTSAKRGPGTGVEVNIRPLEAGGRRMREFATELSGLARSHGVKVVVSSNGWDESMPEGAQEKSWS